MNTTMKLGGAAAAACAACCAVSVVPAVMAGTSLVAIGGAASVWGLGIAALAVPVTALYFLSRRKAAPGANFQSLMASGDDCGCGSACGAAATAEEPIACTLGASDFKERTASIRDLARRSLRHASRTPLGLTLDLCAGCYRGGARSRAQGQSCCAFLAFDLKENAAGVLLTITAPSSAADAADALFDHFAPELAAPKLMAVAVTTRI